MKGTRGLSILHSFTNRLETPFSCCVFLRPKLSFFIVFLSVVKLKGQKMRKFKTRAAYREAYTYHFSDGRTKTIEGGDGVTLEDIAFLHQLDDEEIDRERRENYHIPVHYGNFKQFDREEYTILGSETSALEVFQESKMNKKAKQEQLVKKLKIAISQLTSKQQATIQKIFYIGMNNSELAREEGVSEGAIRHRLSKIYEKLRKNI